MEKLFNVDPTSRKRGLLRSRRHATLLGAPDVRQGLLLWESRHTGGKNSLRLIGEEEIPGLQKEMMSAHF